MMYLLCEYGMNHGEWEALSAGPDESALQAEADALNAAKYDMEHSEWIERGKVGGYPIPLDQTTYRTFFVRPVMVWPMRAKSVMELVQEFKATQ